MYWNMDNTLVYEYANVYKLMCICTSIYVHICTHISLFIHTYMHDIPGVFTGATIEFSQKSCGAVPI